VRAFVLDVELPREDALVLDCELVTGDVLKK